MAEAMTWQESVLQVFHKLGDEWKNFLSDQGFQFDWSAINASGVSWTAEAKNALEQPCNIDLSKNAFCDMPSEVNWIFPGRLAQSVLYHLLASADAAPGLDPAPTQEDIETVENAVYAAQEFNLDDLLQYAAALLPDCEKDPDGNPALRIVVFACEYRASPNTPHGLYADMCYARTGVARAGTDSLPYNESLRGYPFMNSEDPDKMNPYIIPVLPARYSAYLAASCPGSMAVLGQFQQAQDDKRMFWIPVHKLFPGTLCLRDLEVQMEFEARHVNEKLRRFHLYMQSQNIDTNWNTPDIDAYPFVSTQGIAALSADNELGSRGVVPIPHERFVEPAYYQEKLLTFWVPPYPNGVTDLISSSLMLPNVKNSPQGGECHPAPELLNARHQVTDTGTTSQIDNLNLVPDVVAAVRRGNYQALHCIDFTGDGWVSVRAHFLTLDGHPAAAQDRIMPGNEPPCVAAYSLVSAPDFLPMAGQRGVQRLFEAKTPFYLRQNFWNEPPDALADQRNAANITLNQPRITGARMGPSFSPDDDTVTALVSMPISSPSIYSPSAFPRDKPAKERRSYLPDVAAGLLAPGWDVGLDVMKQDDQNVFHLAMYGLGSPFLTDAKLCAALSAFWPAVAPDTARTFEPQQSPQPTIVPLTDQEIGMCGDPPWDGIPGPKLAKAGDYVEYYAFDHADYVEPFLQTLYGPSKSSPLTLFKSPFYMKKLAQIDAVEYVRRLLAMFRVYKALGVPVDSTVISSEVLTAAKSKWAVLFFRPANRADPLFLDAQKSQTPADFFTDEKEVVYFFDVYQWDDAKSPSGGTSAKPLPCDVRHIQIPMKIDPTNHKPIRYQMFVGEREILSRYQLTGAWKVAPKVAGL